MYIKNPIYRIFQKLGIWSKISVFLKVPIFIEFFIEDEKSGSLISIGFFKTAFTYRIFRGLIKNSIVLIERLKFYDCDCTDRFVWSGVNPKLYKYGSCVVKKNILISIFV